MSRTQIIAEIGVNHNGSLLIAKKLIKKAAEAGANYVKFQVYNTEDLIVRKLKKAEYQKKNDSFATQDEMLKKYQLSQSNFLELFNFSKKLKIGFMSSAFDLSSIDFLCDVLKNKIIKIPSSEITNYPYLVHIAKKKKKLILSTGMANLKEIRNAIFTISKFGTPKKNITLFHCVSEYPTSDAKANILSIIKLRKKFNLNIGYSDHTQGIEASKVAVSIGATFIEKHLTLDTKMKGPDHFASINPSNFKKMIDGIKRVEKLLGKAAVKPTSEEIKNSKLVRKKIVALRYIKKGEKFNSNNITTKRAYKGISGMNWNNIIGKNAKKNFLKDEVIQL